MKIINNIPQKKSKDEINFYLYNGPKFGDILFQLYDLIKTKRIKNTHDTIIFFCKKCREIFGYEIRFPFESTKNSEGKEFDYPICISINNCIAHGYSEESIEYKDSDIISIDCGLTLYNNKNKSNLNFDAAFTVQINDNDKWINAPLNALKNIVKFNPANTYDLAEIIETEAEKHNLNQVLALTGHGIGRELHEAPIIHNATGSYRKTEFFEGIVFCAEPIFTEKLNPNSYLADIYIGEDGWSLYTQSGAKGSHFETMFTKHNNKLIDILKITELF